MEVIFGDIKTELEPTKANRLLPVETVEFFDHVTKQKRFFLIYSPYKELKAIGLRFNKNKDKGHIDGYAISMKEKNEKLYLEKELFLMKKRLQPN